MFQPDATFGQPGGLCVRVNWNKEIDVSKMMGSLPGCVYSRAELQSNDCLRANVRLVNHPVFWKNVTVPLSTDGF